MFMNEYRHSIDAKGRLIIPSKYREQCGTSVVITRGFEGCLALYTIEGWNAYYAKLQALPKGKKEARLFVRMITSRACECEFDKQGRINIPNTLINEGNLEKECVVLGAGDYVEIWNADAWDACYSENQPKLDELSKALEEYDL